MKKPSVVALDWHRIHAGKLERRKHRERRREGRRKASERRRQTKSRGQDKPGYSISVLAPSVFNVYKQSYRPDVMQFFSRVQKELKSGARVIINFEGTKELHPCAMLVFMAQLEIWMHRYPNMLSAKRPADDVVEQLFQHFGLLNKLGVESTKAVEHEQVKYWHYYSGEKVTAATYRELMTSITGRVDRSSLFGDCLNEAVSNAVSHAYKFEQRGLPPQEMRRWWMFSQLKEGNLFVAIYDAGISIPASLRTSPEWRDYFRNLVGGDGKMIEVAAGSFRTSTKLGNRGKGLPEMLEFSTELSSGGLAIMSRWGCFSYDAKERVHRRNNYRHPLRGTLVLWTIPFAEDVTGGENDQHS